MAKLVRVCEKCQQTVHVYLLPRGDNEEVDAMEHVDGRQHKVTFYRREEHGDAVYQKANILR